MTAISNLSKPNFMSSVVESTKVGVNWISSKAKNLSASMGDTLGKVSSFASENFAKFKEALSKWFATAKDAVFSLKSQIALWPKESKIFAVVALAATLGLGLFVGKSGKAAVAEKPAANAEAKPNDDAAKADGADKKDEAQKA